MTVVSEEEAVMDHKEVGATCSVSHGKTTYSNGQVAAFGVYIHK